MKENEESKAIVPKTVESQYTKEQILGSKTLEYNKDALSMLLDSTKMYSLSEVKKIYEDFKRKKVM